MRRSSSTPEAVQWCCDGALRLRLLAPLASVLLVLIAPSASAWGFDTHRELASRMHEPLPAGCLKSWLSAKQSASFQDDACDPDRWRFSDDPNYDAEEWPRHFLQIDRADPPSSYPRDYAGAVTQFGDYYAKKNGQVPWRVEEMYARLVEAFRSEDEVRVLREIAHLSHYVTDAFSPLHDSQTTDAKLNESDYDGMHRRYETMMLSSSTDRNSVADEARQYYGTLGRADPRHHLFDIVLTGQPLAEQIAIADFETQGNTDELLRRTREFTARRFGDSLTLLASLVGSAWVDAGSPLLASMPQSCSAEVAQGEVVLLGHMLPAPQPEPQPEPVPDAGTPVAPVVPGETIEPGIGCSSIAGVLALPLTLLVAFALRRRRTASR